MHSSIPKTILNSWNFYAYPDKDCVDGDIMPKTEEFLIETADRCTGLAREGRELVERLEAMRNDLMAKAVELDTTRQKANKKEESSGA
jgi:hypothetical protein